MWPSPNEATLCTTDATPGDSICCSTKASTVSTDSRCCCPKTQVGMARKARREEKRGDIVKTRVGLSCVRACERRVAGPKVFALWCRLCVSGGRVVMLIELLDFGMWDSGIMWDSMWDSGMWDSGTWDSGMWDSGMWDSGIWGYFFYFFVR
jgi:hypothetical protein